MQLARPAYAPDPRRFGRRTSAVAVAAPARPSISDDVKLFAATFFCGFLFVSILIG